jgi:hypothetical protein
MTMMTMMRMSESLMIQPHMADFLFFIFYFFISSFSFLSPFLFCLVVPHASVGQHIDYLKYRSDSLVGTEVRRPDGHFIVKLLGRLAFRLEMVDFPALIASIPSSPNWLT